MTAQKTQASTQKFTEIVDFIGNTVIMTGGNACMVIELTASNFSLLSKKEQDARVYSYGSLLNSLSFPIQILIRNKKMDISSYLKELDTVIDNTKNEDLAKYITYYRSFVEEMVTMNVVLNKTFYIVVPYSSLEQGMKGAQTTNINNKQRVDQFAQEATKILEAKTGTILNLLQRFATTATVLGREELIKLFYDLYNEGGEIEAGAAEKGIAQTIITTRNN